ncbi:hypothetical protein Ani05nite_07590 [Amorphoplanes nipponensis]|uniref:STAS domain-containing protein n=1 Tax=Actinoplanes nipponensis TaxID=135950 RepID=A0A919MRR6_9ACTN|nr:STAS domain-containing protein [Actinoplanes nipponensis]GIE47225.1 hypothetical protein Ani05nite_07590 [Actinoplanes nipponensis]
MTVDAVAADAGVHLICDGCGRVAAASGCGLHDAHVVYVAVGEIGWTGPAFARGPHRCPGCETRGPGHGRRRRQRRTNPTGRVSWQLTRAVCLVRAVGDLDVEIVGDLRAALDTALTEHAVVIVDLTRAASIDPIATGAVLRARQSARRFGTDLLLVASSAMRQVVSHSMRLAATIPTFDTVPQAMSAARALPALPIRGRVQGEPVH